jgi:DNA-binding IclR family transcriptional regulator
LQTVGRALVTLLAFRDRSSWRVTELAEELGIDKSVAQRLLAMLAGRQFVLTELESHTDVTALGLLAHQGGHRRGVRSPRSRTGRGVVGTQDDLARLIERMPTEREQVRVGSRSSRRRPAARGGPRRG